MCCPLCEKLLRALLAVSLLATTSVTAGAAHWHPAGNGPHQHSHHVDGAHSGPEHQHAGPTEERFAPLSHRHGESHVASAEWAGWHVHLALFGWSFAAPTTDGPLQQSEADVQCPELILPAPPGRAVGNGLAHRLPGGCCHVATEALPIGPCIAHTHVFPPRFPSEAIHLSDSARHERSGVQLA